MNVIDMNAAQLQVSFEQLEIKMIPDVTLDEVSQAAYGTLLEAVRCSMKHWLHNATIETVEDLLNVNRGSNFCALCKKTFDILEDFTCPLNPACGKKCYDTPSSVTKNFTERCCPEWYRSVRCQDLGKVEDFKDAASRLYVKLALIEYELLHKKTELEAACEKAKRTGSKEDLDAYLKLRRETL